MRVPQVDIVVPVRNEERDLAPSIRRLVSYLRECFPFTARITIADNGSTDATPAIASGLARELAEVRAVRMEQPGRGRTLRTIWSASDAEVLAYMDVDLSTDLNALLPLVAPLVSGHSDLAGPYHPAKKQRLASQPGNGESGGGGSGHSASLYVSGPQWQYPGLRSGRPANWPEENWHEDCFPRDADDDAYAEAHPYADGDQDL